VVSSDGIAKVRVKVRYGTIWIPFDTKEGGGVEELACIVPGASVG
jgi:hypothetical protein